MSDSRLREPTTKERCPVCGDDLEEGIGQVGGYYGAYLFCRSCKDAFEDDDDEGGD